MSIISNSSYIVDLIFQCDEEPNIDVKKKVKNDLGKANDPCGYDEFNKRLDTIAHSLTSVIPKLYSDRLLAGTSTLTFRINAGHGQDNNLISLQDSHACVATEPHFNKPIPSSDVSDATLSPVATSSSTSNLLEGDYLHVSQPSLDCSGFSEDGQGRHLQHGESKDSFLLDAFQEENDGHLQQWDAVEEKVEWESDDARENCISMRDDDDDECCPSIEETNPPAAFMVTEESSSTSTICITTMVESGVMDNKEHLKELKIATRDVSHATKSLIPHEGFELRQSVSIPSKQPYDTGQPCCLEEVAGGYGEVDLRLKETFLNWIPHAKVVISEYSTGNGDPEWGAYQELGSGGFGKVYFAVAFGSGALMAMKKTNLETTFLKEVNIMKNLRHPNIIGYHGHTTGVEMGGMMSYSIFLEWMPGGSIEKLLTKIGGPFEEDVIRRYYYQTLQGVAYIHKMGYLHRDIKGENVLIDSTGQVVKICDFGMAIEDADCDHNSDCHKNSNKIEGTFAFMAPELFKVFPSLHTQKTDVWSVGCLAIQMATAEHPWGVCENEWQLILKLCEGKLAAPEWLSAGMQYFINFCLTVEPKDRPTAAELLLLMDSKEGTFD